jgi:hypothetical protein
MTPMYALVWRRDGSPGISWYIRCLGHDGFYGEVRYNSPGPHAGGRATGVGRHLTAADGKRVAAILTKLSAAGPTDPGPCFALLGSYTETLGQAVVVFKYELGAETSCPRARLFLELHSIIEAYLSEAYAQIAEPSAPVDAGRL